jgi:hypothetical protein
MTWGTAGEKSPDAQKEKKVHTGKRKRPEKLVEEDEDEEDGEYDRLMKQQWRFFTHETNPTMKCKNCREYGHKARDCPNETFKQSCILCG